MGVVILWMVNSLSNQIGMKQTLIELLFHLPMCLVCCIFTHWVTHKVGKYKFKFSILEYEYTSEKRWVLEWGKRKDEHFTNIIVLLKWNTWF